MPVILLLLLLLVVVVVEFFIFAVADDLLLESEREQVFSDLQDSSQYSRRSQQCCSLDDLDSSSDIQFF